MGGARGMGNTTVTPGDEGRESQPVQLTALLLWFHFLSGVLIVRTLISSLTPTHVPSLTSRVSVLVSLIARLHGCV